MVQIRKQTILILPAAALLVFAAWMLWPRSLGADLKFQGNVSALIITSGVENSQPYQDLEEYNLNANSPEAEALREILSRYSYHLCLDSLTGGNSISDIGSITVGIHDGQGNGLTVHTGTGKLFLQDQVVRTGYWGNARAAALCGELTALLRNTESRPEPRD